MVALSDRDERHRAGALTVDLNARQAAVDDRLLDLTALEFDLLAYLAARPGHVFSRDQLLRAVWHSTAEWQQSATVTEHIRRLRVKIETEPSRPRILRTVRGAGYRLDEPAEHGRVDATDISLEFMPATIVWRGDRALRVAAAERGSVRPESGVPRSDGPGGGAMNEDTGYRALFEHAADAVLVADDDGTYVDANPAAVRMFGVDHGDLIGRRVADFVVDDVDAIEHRWSTFVGSDGESGRVQIRRGDGQTIVCDYNATANFVPGQHLSIMRDVTAMIEAQQRREQSELRFRRMLDALELFALVTDVDGRLTFMNRAMLAQLGVEPSQVIGQRLTLMQPGGEEQHQAFLAAVAAEEITPEWENEIVVADGSTRRVRWSSAFVRDERGRIEAVASIGEDVTVHRRLEEQLRHAVRMESLGRLAGGVAHDFNNFLTVVRGHVDLLAEAPELADTSKAHVDQITAGIDRAARLTRQLLAYGRQQIMEPRDVSVGDVLQHLHTMLTPMLGASVAIEIVRHTDADVVFIDPTQLDQVLVNLAVNARDAMPDGGVLRFEVTTSDIGDAMAALLGLAPGRYVTVSVTDTGDGIPTDLLEHVFEPFVTTKPIGGGTGLGLSTAYGIITQSGGAITADSQLGRGATFVIHLPSHRS